MRNWGAGQVGRDTEVGGVARTCLRLRSGCGKPEAGQPHELVGKENSGA